MAVSSSIVSQPEASGVLLTDVVSENRTRPSTYTADSGQDLPPSMSNVEPGWSTVFRMPP